MNDRLRRFALPAVIGLALFAVALLAGYVSEGDADAARPPDAANAAPEGTRGTVQSLNGDTLLLLTDSGQREFKLTSKTTFEALRPTESSRIVAGDWLNAGAMPNSETFFTVVGLTLIPEAVLRPK